MSAHAALPPTLRSIAPALALVAALAACSSEPEPSELRFTSLGTTVEVKVIDPGSADAEAAVQAAREEIDAVSDAWNPAGDGELAALNERLAQGEGMRVSEELVAILERAQHIERISDGRFSPAIGGLTRLWGFSEADGPLEEPPPEDEIADWVAQEPRLADLEISGREVRSGNDAVQIDLGGIGKGFAGERARGALADAGVAAALISLGGDLVTLRAPADRPWRMGVRHPRDEAILASVSARSDEHVFTSGDYERTFTHAERRYHHILDPTTGYPAMGSRSVTVIHEDPILADASSTALFIAGPEAWRELAEALGIERALLIDAEGAAHMTEAMAERVELERDIEPVHTD